MNISFRGSAIKQFFQGKHADILCIVFAMLFGTFLDWEILHTLFFAVFIASLVWPIPSRVLVFPALFFLAFSPILLLMGRQERAEEFAIYSYYFLVMVVIRAIIEISNGESEDGVKAKE